MTNQEKGALVLQKTTKIMENLFTGEDVRRKFDENFVKLFVSKHNEFNTSQVLDFFHKSQLTGADPRKNEVYLVGYKNKRGEMVSSVLFSYHFLLNQANQTGQLESVNCEVKPEEIFNPLNGNDEKQLVATATVKRKGSSEPVIYRALWSEYEQTRKSIWRDKPYVMLQKCAIAGALRWAFPEALSGVFIKDEARNIDEERYISHDEKKSSIEAEFSTKNENEINLDIKDHKTEVVEVMESNKIDNELTEKYEREVVIEEPKKQTDQPSFRLTD